MRASHEVTGALTDGSAFEGLFQRALKPEGAFATDLLAIGYDVQRPQAKYPARVWRDALGVARKHAYPELSEVEAFHRLGAVFIDGFFETIFGKFISVTLPLLGPGRVVQRLPKYFGAMRSGVQMEARAEAAQRYRIFAEVPEAVPEFMQGLVEAGLRKTGKDVTVKLDRVHVYGYELLIEW